MVDNTSKTIRLTQTVKKGGCAAKLPAEHLRSILQDMNFQSSPQLLTKSEAWDDAAVWKLLSDSSALIQTLDFFTPIVDDPYQFGQIAAANAMSDVYAMGTRPKLALCILAFPAKTLDVQVMKSLMQGALDKIHEASAFLAGGHTIDDDTLKLGFAVSGFVSKDRFWSNAKAQVGDSLILTKPLGVGTSVAAFRKQNTKTTAQRLSCAIKSMIQLNNVVDFCDPQMIHAATDITGFGFLGHAYQMAKASGVSFEIYNQQIPKLLGSLHSIEQGHLVKAHYTNATYIQRHVHYESIEETARHLLNDPQTSGGLLLSLPSGCVSQVIPQLIEHFPHTKVIGKVTEQKDKYLFIKTRDN